MCWGDDGAGLARKQLAAQAGGRTVLAVAAMQAHPDDGNVHECGQQLLEFLPEW